MIGFIMFNSTSLVLGNFVNKKYLRAVIYILIIVAIPLTYSLIVQNLLSVNNVVDTSANIYMKLNTEYVQSAITTLGVLIAMIVDYVFNSVGGRLR